jgi:hypothetical protein
MKSIKKKNIKEILKVTKALCNVIVREIKKKYIDVIINGLLFIPC